MAQSCSGNYSSSSSASASSSYSPSSVLPEVPKLKKKRSLPQCADQTEVQKKKKMKSSSSISTSTSPPLSPTTLRGAMLKVRFADTILKAEKDRLEKIISDPAIVKKELAKLKRNQFEEQERVEAQVREAADLEAKKKREENEKERQRREEIEKERQRLEQIRRQRQRRKEKLERDKMEAAAACREQPYCCTLKQVGILSQCDIACFWGYWGGRCQRPLEQLGLFIKDGEFIEELEEGEIIEELEEGEIY